MSQGTPPRIGHAPWRRNRGSRRSCWSGEAAGSSSTLTGSRRRSCSSPAAVRPRSVAFPTEPVSADAVLLMNRAVLSEFSGAGLGRMLIQGMAKALTRRGVRAIEAFGISSGRHPVHAPGGLPPSRRFKTVRPHHRHPRLRMELRTALTWREDVEVACERLLGR